MNQSMRSFLIAVLLIVIAATTRLIPHIPNFTPIGAIALFGGANLHSRWKWIIPLAAMLLSDIILGFHATMPFVYGSFFLIIVLGRILYNNTSAPRLIATSIIASLLFFLITNFGVWLMSSMYAKTPAGLMDAYILGIPFFRATLLSDLLFNVVLFYGYAFLTNEHVSIRFTYPPKTYRK